MEVGPAVRWKNVRIPSFLSDDSLAGSSANIDVQ